MQVSLLMDLEKLDLKLEQIIQSICRMLSYNTKKPLKNQPVKHFNYMYVELSRMVT